MKINSRERWYEAEKKLSVIFVDVTEAVAELARGHLSGPVATHYLGKACAASALLASETSAADETVIVQMKCSGPLGGFNVECTAAGTLRGYTEKKVLDDFDGLGVPKDAAVLGETKYQITHSVPGKILSQGVAASLDEYLTGSLQRTAAIRVDAEVTDDVEVVGVRGALLERLPDSPLSAADWEEILKNFQQLSLGVASRKLLTQLGLKGAELKGADPLAFACRCSPERAEAILAALSEAERETLPESIDITCHMCGKTFTVRTK